MNNIKKSRSDEWMKATWTNIYHWSIVLAKTMCACFGLDFVGVVDVMREFLHSFPKKVFFWVFFYLFRSAKISPFLSIFTVMTRLHYFAVVLLPMRCYCRPCHRHYNHHAAPIYLFTLFNGLDHCSSFISLCSFRYYNNSCVYIGRLVCFLLSYHFFNIV